MTSSIHNAMKNVIKIASILMLIVCVISLSACKFISDKQPNDNVGQTTSAPTPTPTGIFIDDEDDLLPSPDATGETNGTNTPSTTDQNNVTPDANATATPTLAPGETNAPATATPTLAPGKTNAPATATPTVAPGETNAPETPTLAPMPTSGNVVLPCDPFI